MNLLIPFVREVCLLLGNIDANRSTLLRALRAPGRAVVLVVGGASEALLSSRAWHSSL